MSDLTFYAAWEDFCAVLDFVFNETDGRVYEAYSRFDCELREFKSASEVRAAFSPVENAENPDAQFVAWFPSTGGQVNLRRITLKPGAVPGHTHRFTLDAWGLVQLQFGGLRRSQLKASRIACNTEKRALAWESTSADVNGPVSAWNWRELEKVIRKLQYHVGRRIAVEKGSRPVLEGAMRLREAGVSLREV